MPGLLGKKIGMTNIYTEEGINIPVTVIEAGPCTVTMVRTKNKDGYEALQLGYGNRKTKHTNKPQLVYYKKHNLQPAKYVKEFKNFDVSRFKIGDIITTEIFSEGDTVKISGKSKGKGFQGVIKRHGFGGVGGRTHGQGDRERAPGSIGQSSYPSRVFKGMKMAGRTGNKKITVKNLKIVKIIPEKNILFVKGAVPGAINSIVEINK